MMLMTARPVYCKRTNPPSGLLERNQSIDADKTKERNRRLGPINTKIVTERSQTLMKAIQQLKPIQIWDWLFRSSEMNGRKLLRDGLIDVADIVDCIIKGKCKQLIVKLPAYCILQCLLRSARSESPGLLIADDVELMKSNWPKDKVFEWFLGPLLIMKEQIKQLELDESEEDYLCKLIMTSNNEKPQDRNDSGFPSDDSIRRAQLQAIIRRLQGIVSSMSRMPTFRRRFRNLVKVLYLEAIGSGALSSDGGSSKYRRKMGGSVGRASNHDVEAGSRSEGNTIRSINSPNGPDEEMAGTNGTNRPERPFNGGDIV